MTHTGMPPLRIVRIIRNININTCVVHVEVMIDPSILTENQTIVIKTFLYTSTRLLTT